MLKKLRTSYLLPAELLETILKYISALELSGIAHTFIASIIQLLKTDVENLKKVIIAVRQNRQVERVSEADALRDDLFIGFRDSVDAFKRRRDEKLVEAYGTIWPIIEKAGTTLYALGYTVQSGKMEALISDLDKQENQKELKTLRVLDLYNEMKEAQKKFTDIYDARLDEEAQRDFPTLNDTKKKIVPHVNALLNTMEIIHELEPGMHQELIDKLNIITTEVMSSATSRRTREDREEEEDEEL